MELGYHRFRHNRLYWPQVPLVPHNQSELLYEALKNAGVQVKFHTVKGAGHGGFRDPQVDRMVEYILSSF